MRVILDLDTCELIVPKNFFREIERQNALIERAGGTPIKAVDLIRKSFETAVENSDKHLHVNAPKVRGKVKDKEED